MTVQLQYNNKFNFFKAKLAEAFIISLFTLWTDKIYNFLQLKADSSMIIFFCSSRSIERSRTLSRASSIFVKVLVIQIKIRCCFWRISWTKMLFTHSYFLSWNRRKSSILKKIRWSVKLQERQVSIKYQSYLQICCIHQ